MEGPLPFTPTAPVTLRLQRARYAVLAALLLVCSQWLAIVHAGEHLLDDAHDSPACAVCAVALADGDSAPAFALSACTPARPVLAGSAMWQPSGTARIPRPHNRGPPAVSA